jgi:hypothetical protein
LQHQTSQYKKTPVYITAASQSEAFEEVRKSLQSEIERLIEAESEKLGKVCVRFGTQIELLLNIDKQRKERNEVARLNLYFLNLCRTVFSLVLLTTLMRYICHNHLGL